MQTLYPSNTETTTGAVSTKTSAKKQKEDNQSLKLSIGMNPNSDETDLQSNQPIFYVIKHLNRSLNMIYLPKLVIRMGKDTIKSKLFPMIYLLTLVISRGKDTIKSKLLP